jgi:hypothetical protein
LEKRSVDALVLKLVMTPLLIVTATLVGRKWGPALSGWLIGLPFTSGPVTFFLAVSHGTAFATAAAIGTLTGTLSECAFCLAYGWLSAGLPWPPTLVLSALAFGLATFGLSTVALSPIAAFAVVIVGLLLSIQLMPPAPSQSLPHATVPSWDLPARAAVATAFVIGLTTVAPLLGPKLTGLIAPFPIFASILASFAHQQQGSNGAILVVRGLLIGLFAFATFFLVLALALEPLGIALAFVLATLAALLTQGVSLAIMRETKPAD